MALVKTVQRDPKFPLSDGSAAFSPGNIPGLIVWLDASNAGTVTVVSNNVQQINDLSGHGNHFQAPAAGQRPTYTAQINLLNVMTFVRANPSQLNCVNALTMGPSFTIVTAAKATLFTSPAGIFAGDDAGSNRFMQYRWNSVTAPESIYFPGGGANTLDSIGAADITAAAHCFMSIADNTGHTSTNYFDGTQNGQNTGLAAFSAVTMTPQLGRSATNGTNWWDGPVGEVIIYNAALTSTQRANVSAYLRGKWGTP